MCSVNGHRLGVLTEALMLPKAIRMRGSGVGNRYVKIVGTAVAAVAILMIVIGIGLKNYEETQRTWIGYITTKPYEDLGDQLFFLGVVFIVLGVIISLAGVFAGPSRREVRLAQRKEERRRARLSRDTDSDSYVTECEIIIPTAENQRSDVATKHCRYCGEVVPKDSSFCEHCGKRL